MNLPEWDDATTKLYQHRWKAINRLDTSSSETSVSESNSARVGSAPDIEALTSIGRSSLEYESIYVGLSHLLYTQVGNPPTRDLIRHLDGSRNRRSYYHELEVAKKRGGTRVLAVPKNPLKWLQRSLLVVLTHLFPRHKCAHGFERGKSIITHAKQHVRKRYVYTIDIKDFFPSITRNRVFGMFKAYPFRASTHVARYLANLTCYKGNLPQGAPTSPVISNLICRKLDSRLFKWARSNGYDYSRYADDLTFSTNRNSFPRSDQAFIDQIIQDEGFEVNEDKRRLQPYYKRQMVTGLVVNEKVNIPREKIRGLRALLHNIKENGWQSQVGRTSVFDNAEDWRAYVNGRLDLADYNKVDQHQSDKHKLINPSAQLPHVNSEDDLRRHVQGRVAFIGAVRGVDDSLYQRLKATYEKLRSRLEQHLGDRSTGEEEAQERRKTRQKVEQELIHGRQENKPSHYRQISNWVRTFKKSEEELSFSELRDRLGSWKDHSLEVVWLLRRHSLNRPENRGDFIDEAFKIAWALDTSPSETAHFFSEFMEDGSFRGLLHPPEPDFPSPSQIVGACEDAVNAYDLPNGLEKAAERVVNKCNTWVEANQGEYPWNEMEGDLLANFKKVTRFEARGDGSLTELLRDTAKECKEKYKVEVAFETGGRFFRTHVPSVLPALKRLIHSMAENTRDDSIHVAITTGEVVENLPEAVIRIWDNTSIISKDYEASKIFTGDTQRVLYNQKNDCGLRGYARWTMIAPFSNGETYEFDLMRNKKSRNEDHNSGVMHRITFYQ